MVRQYHNSGEISYVFSRFLKTGRDGADVTSLGKLFHTLAPATGKARPTTVDRRKNGTSIWSVDCYIVVATKRFAACVSDVNYKKPALTRVQRPTPAMFLPLAVGKAFYTQGHAHYFRSLHALC